MIQLAECNSYTGIHEDLLSDFTIDLTGAFLLLGALR